MGHGKERRTVAALISPVAVWPAQKTRPGTLTAGPGARIVSSVLFRQYPRRNLQLCGLVGNFSLEMSWRDILVSGVKRKQVDTELRAWKCKEWNGRKSRTMSRNE